MFSDSSDEDDVSSRHIPTMYLPSVDINDDKIEDAFEKEVQEKIAEGNGTQLARFVVLLNAAPSITHTSVLARYNGTVTREPWQQALFGFAGRLPYMLIATFADMCPDLLLVQRDHEYTALMAYAASQGRVRPYVWDILGYTGDPLSSIAISDSGIDDTHPSHGSYGSGDFSKKIVGWRDDVGSGSTPYDDNGHGSHCAGVSAGEGFDKTDASGRAVATWSASFPFSSSGTYIITGFNVTKGGTIRAEVKWDDDGSISGSVDTMLLYYAGYSGSTSDWIQVDSVGTPNKNTVYTLEYDVIAGEIGYYHILLDISSGLLSNGHILVTLHWPYDSPVDGYPAWTGVAKDVKLVGLKGLDNTGSGFTSDLVSGINWAVANRETYHILVLSMSWGGASYDTAIDNAVSNAVGSGIVCVASGGNDGSGGNYIHSPGSNPYGITVAATSVVDNITSYSSQGGSSEAESSVVKPDITAPGGSFYYLPIFSTDSNDQDADDYYPDYYGNDSASMQGTSMSAPFIAGSAAIVAQVLGGYTAWNFSSNAIPLKVKMLLLMTATEAYPFLREKDTAASPMLNRGGKDVHEGYGRVNVDAAVEAATLTYRVGEAATESFGASPFDRKCWARNVYLHQGTDYKLNLTVPAGADYDLYLYNTTGNMYGEPVILANSTTAAVGGLENITYAPTLSGTYYLVVKRAREDTGIGQFTVTSSPRQAVYLQLMLDPDQIEYAEGQQLTLKVNIFNQQNPPLEADLIVTIIGSDGYYFYDFQTVNVAAASIKEYSFSWEIPAVDGWYVVETSLVPPRLTAYDVLWLEVA